MAAKHITLKINSARETVETLQITTQQGRAAVVKAQPNVRYQLIDEATQFGPENIMTKRVGQDLHISFEGSPVEQPDLIIQDYYASNGTIGYSDGDANIIIGQHENGNFYSYVPESAQSADAISVLAEEMTAGQALGGHELVAPFWAPWIGATASNWLWAPLVAAGVGGLAAAIVNSGSDDDERPAEPTPPGTAPVANDDLASTPIDTPVTIDVKANDSDADHTLNQLTVGNLVVDPAQGTATLTPDGQIIFTPAPGFTGPAKITYTLTDPDGQTDTAVVTVNVGANTPPDSADETRTIAEDSTYAFSQKDFAFTDADNHSFHAVRIDTLPKEGVLSLNGNPVTVGQVIPVGSLGNLVFTPAKDGNGTPYTSFTFSVQDSNGAYDTKPNTITINITPANDPPVANDDVVSTPVDKPVVIDVKANDTDPDNTKDELKVSNPVVDPAKGTATVTPDGKVQFTPKPGVTGPVEITYTLTDPDGKSDTAKITVNVGSSNPPDSEDKVFTINEDTSQGFKVSDFAFKDPDAGQTMKAVRIDELPGKGSLTLNGVAVTAGQVIAVADLGKLSYSPAANENGNNYANFKFSVQDSAGVFDLKPNTVCLRFLP